ITTTMYGGCTNSEIDITKNFGTWGTFGGGAFINDLTTSLTSYTNASAIAIVSYGSTGHYDLVVDGVNYTNFLYVRTNRALPTFSPSMLSTVCEGDMFTMNTPTPGAEYEWLLFEGTNTTATPVAVYNTSIASFSTPVTGATVNYHVRLRVRDNCCGWSVPIYFDFAAVPVSAGPTVTFDTVCAGQSGNITATGSGTLNWYSDALGQIIIASGPAPSLTLVTPVLNQNTVFYTGQSTGGCSGPLTSSEVLVNQLPNMPSANPVEVCEGDDVVLSGTGSGTGDIVFFNSSFTEISRTTMSVPVPNASFNTGALSAGSYTFYVQEDDGNCLSPLKLIGVTVNSLPVAPTSSGTTICSGESTTLTASASGIVNWYADAGMTNLLGTGSAYTTAVLTSTISYFVAQVDGNSCESPNATVTVTVDPLPVDPIGTGAAICSGATASISATNSGGTLNWYSDAAGSNMVATGSPFVTPALTQNTTYFVQEVNGGTNCESSLIAVTVTVNQLPNTPSSAPVVVCSGEDIVIPATGSGTGNLLFYDNLMALQSTVAMGGIPTQSFNAGALAAGNYLFYITEDDGTCESLTAAVGVTVNALPAAPIATGTTICSGSATTLSATASGTVNWYSDTGLTNLIGTGTIYTTGSIIVDTDYYLTQIDTNGCESDSTTVSVSVDSIPSNPVLVADTVCMGAAATLTASGSGGTLNWYSDASGTVVVGTGTVFTTIALSQNTTYYVQEVATTSCISNIIAVTAVVDVVPATPSTGSVSVCEGQDVILSATGSGTGDLVFYDNTLTEVGRVAMSGNPNATFNAGPLISGNYVYYTSEDNGSCESNLGVIGVVVNTRPVTPVVAGTTICEGSTATLTATGSVQWYSDGGLTNMVSSNNTFTTMALTSSTDYFVVAVDGNGCVSNTDTVTVNVDSLPAAPVTLADTICEGSSATLAAIGSGGTLNWYSDAAGVVMIGAGDSINVLVVNQTTTFYVEETDTATGCISSMSPVTVIVTPVLNPPSAADIVICSGTDVILSATGSGVGELVFYDDSLEIGRVAMTPLNNFGTFNAGQLAVNTYVYYVAQDLGNCLSTLQSINVEVRALPAAPSVFNDSPVCEGETVFLQSSTVVGATYGWTGPGGFTSTIQNITLANITSAEAGTYDVAVTLNGCTSSADSTIVTVNPRPALVGPLTSNSPLCDLDSLSIDAPVVAGVSYSWTGPNGFASLDQNVSIGSVIETDHQGFYSLEVVDSVTGCASLPLSTLVMIASLPDAGMATNNGPVCFGTPMQLEVLDVFGATYSWTGPNGFTSTLRTPTIAPTQLDTGVYTVVVSVNNCSSFYETFVTAYELPILTHIIDTSTAIGVPIQLWASGGIAFDWSPPVNLDNASIANPVFSSSIPGTYAYNVTTYNVHGCLATDRVNIFVDPSLEPNYNIVNLFTPNGDGVNDYWTVDFLQAPTIGPYTLQIISRGGMEILNTQNYQNDWYGTYKDKLLPDGTYWYIIHLENDDRTIKGAVTIKR
ncbi:gliding motility-associated C-terminal domain-containing protein, partial [Aureispira]|nr:gliding motility-associated C-terminal domain-containing protein [Aureispira sp.]